MNLQTFGKRVVRRYGADIKAMAGGGVRPATFQFGNDGTFTSGTGITIDRQDWQGMGRRDRRGMLIHELAHVATRDQGLGGTSSSAPWASQNVEQGADAIRLALNGRAGINPDSLSGARRIAQTQGWLGDDMTNPAGNGPRAGRGAGRFRDTLANNASKQSPNGFQAPASSGTMVGAGDQLAANRYDYLAKLAALKAQRPLIGQQYGLAMADARSAAVSNMVSAEADQLERGGLGSSMGAQSQAAVLAERTRAFADASNARTAAKLGLGSQALDARSQYYMNNASIQNALYQDSMANTIAAFGDDLFGTIRAQKYGSAPRRRSGTGPAGGAAPAPPPPQYAPGVIGSQYAPTYTPSLPNYGGNTRKYEGTI